MWRSEAIENYWPFGKKCQYYSGISRARALFLGESEETFKNILTTLPWSRTLGFLCSTTTSGDLGSDELIFSTLPVSPSPSQRLQEFPSCKRIN